MIDLDKIQSERATWAHNNFGYVPTWQNVLGVCEEAGELSHAVLKDAQNIRGDHEKHVLDAEDAIGDLVMYLLGVCDNLNLHLSDVIVDVSKKVMKRDWKADPIKGESQ